MGHLVGSNGLDGWVFLCGLLVGLWALWWIAGMAGPFSVFKAGLLVGHLVGWIRCMINLWLCGPFGAILCRPFSGSVGLLVVYVVFYWLCGPFGGWLGGVGHSVFFRWAF